MFRFAILDVDDVLIETARASREAAAVVAPALEPFMPVARAHEVQERFRSDLEVLRERLQSHGADAPAYVALRRRIEGHQRSLLDAGYDLKEWSRHVLLACALSDAGVAATRETIDAGADRYWEHVEKSATVYPDVPPFLAELRARGIAIHLATNSDGFLGYDDAQGGFRYDPEWGRDRKHERLGAVWRLGFEPRNVTVGDPIGKAHPGFAGRVLGDFEAACGEAIDPSRTFALGDSLGSDVQPFLARGVGAGFWLRRHDASPVGPLPPAVRVVPSLSWERIAGT